MKNILKKLHAIMSEVERIEKDKTNEFHRYKYASEQAIKEAIHPLLVKHKVLFTTNVTNARREVYVTAKGARGAITDIDLAYTFHDVESGEALTGTFQGTGDDGADKGTYKAITGAIKYILTSTFLIPTGDDPEVETSNDKVTPQYVSDVMNSPIPNTVEGMGNQRMCAVCGASMNFKEGTSKAGKAYKGYFCPTDKTHSPIWM